MALTPEQRIAETRSILEYIYDNKGKIAKPTELWEDSKLSERMRKDLVRNLTEKGIIAKQGSYRNVQYAFVEEYAEELVELIDNPSALSAFLWPRFEGHMGSIPPPAGSSGQLEESSEEEAPEETANEASFEGATDRQMLEGIATNLHGLTQLIAAMFTHQQENGRTGTIDLTPFVKSYTKMTERFSALENRVKHIEAGLGLVNGSEEEPRGSSRGVQDESQDDRKGEGPA